MTEKGLRSIKSFSADSDAMFLFDDLFRRGKLGKLHCYESQSAFFGECMNQFIKRFEHQLNLSIEIPPELRTCKKCGVKFAAVYSFCPACQAEWKP